ncbi:hypothetical protein PgNI_10445 [Pyricularia grisea]|uniref:Uncharacterized protein n=1 Tax=Pyricularia grisea TaxID=148305 RepID=A0A6P8AY92_PYRGI|nr:hypothetical protein PgNI_10445 [Pyricularia grisea]TLD07302.1 hypothetical protein PgNI_10445 [Pyricularia grisea]
MLGHRSWGTKAVLAVLSQEPVLYGELQVHLQACPYARDPD